MREIFLQNIINLLLPFSLPPFDGVDVFPHSLSQTNGSAPSDGYTFSNSLLSSSISTRIVIHSSGTRGCSRQRLKIAREGSVPWMREEIRARLRTGGSRSCNRINHTRSRNIFNASPIAWEKFFLYVIRGLCRGDNKWKFPPGLILREEWIDYENHMLEIQTSSAAIIISC